MSAQAPSNCADAPDPFELALPQKMRLTAV